MSTPALDGAADAGDTDDAAFTSWRALRAERGDRATIIDLYALVAASRGCAPQELPREERLALARRALTVVWPNHEVTPDSDRPPDTVDLVPYDPAWPARFDEWRTRIAAALAGVSPVRISHIGSTSIAGMLAKPTVDILIGVPDPGDETAYAPQLESTGLVLRSRDDLHRFFYRPRDVHVHVCKLGSAWEREHLLFRDYLRANPPAQARYVEAKQRAAVLWHDDRLAYTDAKNDVILDLLDDASRWAASTGWSL